MSGEGVPTLQSDQLNVIAHHLNGINNEEDNIWVIKMEWPQQIDPAESIKEKVKINLMKQSKVKLTGFRLWRQYWRHFWG
jgi:hypothetical protein